mgnify:CR=1 FL=1
MRSISIDIETFSDVDLSKCGVYKYASSPNFEILLFGYSVDGGDVRVVDLCQGEEIPKEILAALSDESVTKWAFNAMFERVCLSNYLGEWHFSGHDRKSSSSPSAKSSSARDLPPSGSPSRTFCRLFRPQAIPLFPLLLKA